MLVASVLVGAVLTLVSVAAPPAVIWCVPNARATQPTSKLWSIDEFRATGGILIYVRAHPQLEQEIQRVDRAHQELIELRGWAQPRPTAASTLPFTIRERTTRSRAVPARIPNDPAVFIRSGWPLHAGEGLPYPLRPIWPGLLANTLCYATVTLALLVSVCLIRARRRRKRGCCVACGYELGEGLRTCPECGLEAESRA